MATTDWKKRAPVVITGGLILVVLALFAWEFVVASTTVPDGEVRDVTANTYDDLVTPLLVNADAARGATLILETYECHVCHIQNGGQIAPAYTSLGTRAATAHMPLSAAAYLYESIVYPAAFVVDGYSSAMPANYRARMSDRDLGDVIAYLLTQ